MLVNNPKSRTNRKVGGHENYGHRKVKILLVDTTRYQAKSTNHNVPQIRLMIAVLPKSL